jgi:hypothetical protein
MGSKVMLTLNGRDPKTTRTHKTLRRSVRNKASLMSATPSCEPVETLGMTTQALTGLLAERVMNWAAAPNRFMTGHRTWIPRWRFQPSQNLTHAFQLLAAAMPKRYSVSADETGYFRARVQIGKVAGESRNRSMPLAITCAVARASGLM